MNNITKIAEIMVEIVKSELEDDLTLTAIEQKTQAVLQEVGRQTVAKTLKTLDKPYPEATVACECGDDEATYMRRRSACLHTLFGKVAVTRAYYLCPTCHQGTYPLDKKLGLRPNALSAELARLAAMVGVQLPFGTGRDLLEALILVSVSDQAMGKATRQVGDKVVDKETVEQKRAQDESFRLQQRRERRRPLRLYGTMDATKVHIRDDGEHRWRDLKIGAWFEASGQPPTSPEGQWSIQAKNIHYYTDICSANEFGDLLWSSGLAHDAQLAHELVMLGDGAEWIWNLVATHFPKAIQILDWFHACEHLLPVAQAAFAAPQDQKIWVTQMKQLMWEGQIEELIAACDTLLTTCSSDVIRITANYFQTHKERMQYAHFRKQGYQIGSGTIESAAKQIGLMRMKVPGAIWNEDNARLVAKARAAYLSDQWQSLPLAV
ncbi:MAG: ISKra4 family transposase [Ardenticatenaceae bacterium]|nr:ISKra4 family transposase [Ardenticatenaceae bacterium]